MAGGAVRAGERNGAGTAGGQEAVHGGGNLRTHDCERPPARRSAVEPGRKQAHLPSAGASGEQESLYYFDPASGKSATLISADKLAALTPSAGNLKDERQRENRARFGVADYQWSPDSRRLLFDALGQLWIFDLAVVERAPD